MPRRRSREIALRRVGLRLVARSLPNDLTSLLHQLHAVQAYRRPIVRVPINDERLIKQYLDLGVRNLLVPMVHTKWRNWPQSALIPRHGSSRRRLSLPAHQCGTIGLPEPGTRNHYPDLPGPWQCRKWKHLSVDGVDAIFVGRRRSRPRHHRKPPTKSSPRQTLHRRRQQGRNSWHQRVQPDVAREYIGPELTSSSSALRSDLARGSEALATEFLGDTEPRTRRILRRTEPLDRDPPSSRPNVGQRGDFCL